MKFTTGGGGGNIPSRAKLTTVGWEIFHIGRNSNSRPWGGGGNFPYRSDETHDWGGRKFSISNETKLTTGGGGDKIHELTTRYLG